MAERITVPIVGSTVNQATQSEAAPMRDRERNSLHRVSGLGAAMSQQTAQEPQWGENPDGSARLTWQTTARPEPKVEAPVARSGGDIEAMRAQVGVLESMVGNLLANRLNASGGQAQEYGAGVEGRRNEAPDPRDFDIYTDEGMAEYQKANAEFINAVTEERKRLELEPYRGALYEAALQSEFAALQREHGRERNFMHVAKAALHEMAENPGLGLREAFEKMNDAKAAKPGQRSGHLPESLTKKKLPTLGQIMLHNRMSGRAAPVNKRGNRWGF